MIRNLLIFGEYPYQAGCCYRESGERDYHKGMPDVHSSIGEYPNNKRSDQSRKSNARLCITVNDGFVLTESAGDKRKNAGY